MKNQECECGPVDLCIADCATVRNFRPDPFHARTQVMLPQAHFLLRPWVLLARSFIIALSRLRRDGMFVFRLETEFPDSDRSFGSARKGLLECEWSEIREAKKFLISPFKIPL